MVRFIGNRRETINNVRKDLDLICLNLIDYWNGAHGYKIGEEINRLFGVSIRNSTLYPLLNELESEGYTRSKNVEIGNRERREYELLQKGRDRIRELMVIKNRNISIIKDIGEPSPATKRTIKWIRNLEKRGVA